MAWIILIVAGLFEVAWASLLESTKGFTRLWPTVGFLVTLAISMYLLSVATRSIPVGTGYAVWVGIGAVGAFLVGVLIKGDDTNPGQVAAILALVASAINTGGGRVNGVTLRVARRTEVLVHVGEHERRQLLGCERRRRIGARDQC